MSGSRDCRYGAVTPHCLSGRTQASPERPRLARINHETPWRHRGDGRATGQPQSLGPEADFFSTPQGEFVLSLSKEHPRTPGRTAIFAVAAGGSCIVRPRVKGAFWSGAAIAGEKRRLIPPFSSRRHESRERSWVHPLALRRSIGSLSFLIMWGKFMISGS